MDTNEIHRLLTEAQRVANERGFRRLKCPQCLGQGEREVEDANAPGGRIVRDCGDCTGTGWVYFSAAEGLDMAAQRSSGLLSPVNLLRGHDEEKQ